MRRERIYTRKERGCASTRGATCHEALVSIGVVVEVRELQGAGRYAPALTVVVHGFRHTLTVSPTTGQGDKEAATGAILHSSQNMPSRSFVFHV